MYVVQILSSNSEAKTLPHCREPVPKELRTVHKVLPNSWRTRMLGERSVFNQQF